MLSNVEKYYVRRSNSCDGVFRDHAFRQSPRAGDRDGKAEKLQSGQMPYFDVVPDPIEGFTARPGR